ncbi:hypothetical protein AWJ20_305 [Sugiyamaella lignohabitans]|uniref:Amidohydrolase-related domain-containing protein n=1 Tax=Sugiyamaella lignohabitans TaxID=796027 RepID=A0A167CSY3_9ASCO|nr:uncharacterized protein AWJ20_305 [Sugiyamaella lignohabitans]ANB12070.1 hypothetical protein AWJ20_305 [Sugiyamaella lignohabitans]
MTRRTRRVIDSHVHLFDRSHLDKLAWMTADSPLNEGNDLVRYGEECHDKKPRNLNYSITGLIFIEADRKVLKPIDDPSGWDFVLDEYKYVDRIRRNELLSSENSAPLPSIPVKAVIPWAPVPSGRKVLEKYISELKKAGAQSSTSVKGFRYLVQDKPNGVMLEEGFIEGVNYLGEEGYIFELGIDIRSGGLWQLEEAISLVKKIPNTVIIIGE